MEGQENDGDRLRDMSVEPNLPANDLRSSPAPGTLSRTPLSAVDLPTPAVPISSPIEPQTDTVVNNVPGFRYKYPEAAPTPPGIDDVSWNKLYTAADSRMYNKHGKDANSSRKYRASGETRTLALTMMEEKRKKEAAGILPRGSKPKSAHVPAPRELPLSSRDGTPSSDIMTMSISEKIKAEGRARKTSVGPASTGGTPQPSLPGNKEFVKRGIAKSANKPVTKKRKLAHTPSGSARASQTPDVSTAAEGISDYDSDASTRSGTLYCICRKPDDHSLMIECVACRNWFHPPCMNIAIEDAKDDLVDKFVCHDCTTPERMTNFKRICRRFNVDKKFGKCRKAARVNERNGKGEEQVPSKYCSEECKVVFWKYVASLLRKDEQPSVGGAINRYEVANMLKEFPVAADFHRLGRKPKSNTDMIIDSKPHVVDEGLLSEHERRIVEDLRQLIKENQERIVHHENQQILLRMIDKRAKEATQYVGRNICGYDPRLSFNFDEFIIWYGSEEAKKAFSTGVIHPIPEETRRLLTFLPQLQPLDNDNLADELKDVCTFPRPTKCRHAYWRELHNQDYTEHIYQCNSAIANAEREIKSRIEEAETREATASYYAQNKTTVWSETLD